MDRPPLFHFLYHDKQHRLLICKKCNIAINASSVTQHSSTEGHPHTSLADRNEAQKWASTLETYTTETWDFGQVLPQPIPHLTIENDMPLCTACEYICKSAGTMKKHIQQHHPGAQLNFTTKNTAHQVFGKRKSTFNLVRDIFPQSSPPIDAIKNALELFRLKQLEVTRQFENVTSNGEPQAATPWLNRTQFRTYLGGLSAQDVDRLLADTSDETMQAMKGAFVSMVTIAYENVHSIPNIVLRFVTAHSSILPDQPMLLNQTPHTVQRYIELGWKLFKAIIRRPEVLSPVMLAGHGRLLAAFTTPSGSEKTELLQFIIHVLEEKTWNVHHRPCLMYGLALFAYDTQRNIFRQGSDCSPTMAAFKFVCRMLITTYVYHPDDRLQERRAEYVRDYAVSNIHDTSASAFSELTSILAYAKQHKDDYAATPFSWNRDGTEVEYLGNLLPIVSFKKLLCSWLERLVNLLPELSFSTLLQCRMRYDPKKIQDNPQWANSGHSFIDMTFNIHLQGGHEHILHRMRSSKNHLSILDPEAGFRVGGVTNYSSSVVEFQELLALCLHTLCGGVARGTELFSLLRINTQTSLRGVFVQHGEVFTLTTYHKSQTLQDAPKLIARFCPPDLGMCIIAYIADILPFESFLSVAVGAQPAMVDPRLFPPCGSNSWDTKRLTGLLQDHSRASLGSIDLTVSSYRQISIAIRQKHVDQNMPQLASIGAIQTCHSEATERGHYALTASGLRSLSPEAVDDFRSMSTAWYRFVLGPAADVDPNPPLEPQSTGLQPQMLPPMTPQQTPTSVPTQPLAFLLQDEPTICSNDYRSLLTPDSNVR
jgi:hypothetical protein